MLITKKITNHAIVYENHGLEVPPYRLTFKEHKQLVKEIQPFLEKFGMKSEPYEFIANYYGVQIEVVTKIEV